MGLPKGRQGAQVSSDHSGAAGRPRPFRATDFYNFILIQYPNAYRMSTRSHGNAEYGKQRQPSAKLRVRIYGKAAYISTTRPNREGGCRKTGFLYIPWPGIGISFKKNSIWIKLEGALADTRIVGRDHSSPPSSLWLTSDTRYGLAGFPQTGLFLFLSGKGTFRLRRKVSFPGPFPSKDAERLEPNREPFHCARKLPSPGPFLPKTRSTWNRFGNFLLFSSSLESMELSALGHRSSHRAFISGMPKRIANINGPAYLSANPERSIGLEAGSYHSDHKLAVQTAPVLHWSSKRSDP